MRPLAEVAGRCVLLVLGRLSSTVGSSDGEFFRLNAPGQPHSK